MSIDYNWYGSPAPWYGSSAPWVTTGMSTCSPAENDELNMILDAYAEFGIAPVLNNPEHIRFCNALDDAVKSLAKDIIVQLETVDAVAKLKDDTEPYTEINCSIAKLNSLLNRAREFPSTVPTVHVPPTFVSLNLADI